jgi:hypothetical protein
MRNDLMRIVRMAQFQGYRGIITTSSIQPDRIAFCRDGEIIRFGRIDNEGCMPCNIEFERGRIITDWDDGDVIEIDVMVLNEERYGKIAREG